MVKYVRVLILWNKKISIATTITGLNKLVQKIRVVGGNVEWGLMKARLEILVVYGVWISGAVKYEKIIHRLVPKSC